MTTDSTVGTDGDGMAALAIGDAVAIGEDSYTSVTIKLKTLDNGKVAIAIGTAEGTAAAESPPGDGAYTGVETDFAVDGADLVIELTRTSSGDCETGSYESSTTMFRAIDISRVVDAIRTVSVELSQDGGCDDLDLDGNVAIAAFEVEVRGDDNFAGVDAFVLAVEDELSLSTVLATAASG